MDYELKISQAGKDYKKYNINGEDLIGVQKNEPFEIYFKNNTGLKLQVRLSLDGTDIITGDPASTKPTGQMWVVKPYDSMTLKAWPEANNGGSAFVFTDPEKGVAVNTHGIKAGIGLIAAAVYVENQPSYTITNFPQAQFWNTSNRIMPLYGISRNAIPLKSSGIRGQSLGGVYSSTAVPVADSFTIAECSDVSVGAGEFTAQAITKEAGLNKPVLNEIIQIRYLSWAKLEKLIAKAQPKENAFPGDKPEKRINFSKVPKAKSSKPVEMPRFV